ncbi:MAG: hypothetical protein Q9M40_02480 [Sulfurimonas sp.]|nr:hypothetical protein [Sulfurimonas sp.]
MASKEINNDDKISLLTLSLTTLLFSDYTNCNFKNRKIYPLKYVTDAVKNGVSHKYANSFLLSYFKTKKFR